MKKRILKIAVIVLATSALGTIKANFIRDLCNEVIAALKKTDFTAIDVGITKPAERTNSADVGITKPAEKTKTIIDIKEPAEATKNTTEVKTPQRSTYSKGSSIAFGMIGTGYTTYMVGSGIQVIPLILSDKYRTARTAKILSRCGRVGETAGLAMIATGLGAFAMNEYIHAKDN